MMNISDELKEIYKNDRAPASEISYPKDMEAYFPDLSLTIANDQFADDKGEFELSEGISDDDDIKFGKCNSSQVKFTVADVNADIVGKEFQLKQTVDKPIIKLTRLSGASSQAQTVQGKNLIEDSATANISSRWSQNGWSGSFTKIEDGVYRLTANNGWHVAKYKLDSSYAGKTLTISFHGKKISSETTSTTYNNIFVSNATGTNPYSSGYFKDANGNIMDAQLPPQDEWIYCEATVVLNADAQLGIGSRCSPENQGLVTVWYIKDLQLELGSAATSYEPFVPDSPSPEYPSPIVSAHDFDITASNGMENNSVHVADTLRSLPNGTKDTYEVIGGVLTKVQRIARVDNSAWFLSNTQDGLGHRFTFISDNIKLNGYMLCTHALFRVVPSSATPGDYVACNEDNRGFFRFDSYTGTVTTQGFIDWATANNFECIYELAEPVYTPVEDITLQSYGQGTQVTTTAEPQVGVEYEEQYVTAGELPFGYYKVDTAPKQDDLRFKDITAYDRMQKCYVDVADWYNSLTFPMTLAAFRASFLAYVGLEEDTSTLPLPNDSMAVERTVEAAQLAGQEVIEAIEEINCVFGVITPEGKFGHVILEPMYGDYPLDDYPTDDYPISETDATYIQTDPIDETVSVAMRESIRFQEYTTPEIDKLIVRGEEDDIGAIVGEGTNAYVIEGNFLVFGKSASELQTIAKNAFGYAAKRPYRSYECAQIGLPYVKPGDLLQFDQDEPVVGYVLNRTLHGVQSLRDEYASPGSAGRVQNTSRNTEIKKLKYRATKIQKDVDGVSVEVSDLEAATSTQFAIMSDQIDQRVEKNGVIQAINLSTEGLTIDVTKLDINGIVTANGNFKILLDGSMEAVNGQFSGDITASTINGTTITGGTINGTTINGSTFTSSDSNGTLTIAGTRIEGYNSTGGLILLISSAGNITATNIATNNISCSTINNYTPITSNNIGSQYVAHAVLSDVADSAGTAYSVAGVPTSQITASNTGYGNIDFQGFDNACGVNWAQTNFAPKTSSDVRLKCDISSLDSLPDELFYSLKPKQFRYKTDIYGKGKFFGLIAQQVESAFQLHGLDPYDYDLIEVKDVRKYTDDGFYVKGETHRINYNNMIGWMIHVIQEQNERISMLENH